MTFIISILAIHLSPGSGDISPQCSSVSGFFVPLTSDASKAGTVYRSHMHFELVSVDVGLYGGSAVLHTLPEAFLHWAATHKFETI